jgi:hypothetical protein
MHSQALKPKADAVLSSSRSVVCRHTAHTGKVEGEGFVGDPWLSILLTLCHISHFGSHWLVLDHLIKLKACRQGQGCLFPGLRPAHACGSCCSCACVGHLSGRMQATSQPLPPPPHTHTHARQHLVFTGARNISTVIDWRLTSTLQRPSKQLLSSPQTTPHV